MDLLSRAARNVRAMRGPVRRSSQFGDSSIPPPGGGFSGSGVVTETAALSISTALNCVRVLYDDQSILPFVAYSGQKYGGVRQPLADQPPIVAAPFGPDLPVAVGMSQLMASVKVRGAGYMRVLDTDRLGFPTLMQVLHPDVCKPKLVKGAKKWTVTAPSGGQETLGADEMRQIDGVMMPGAIKGLDPITYQRVLLGEALDVAAFGANFFRNGASPNGVIAVPGAGDRRKAREVKDIWEAGHAGVVNSHRPAVMFGGATFTPLTMSNENAQFLATRTFLREEIAGWFGVPLQRLQAITKNASQGGGKGLDSIEQGYVTHTLLPFAVGIEALWDAMVPGGLRTWTAFDFSGLLRAAALERAQIAQIHRMTGVRNRNEVRAEEGWAPIPGPDGEDYNLPFNTNSQVPPLLEPGVEKPASDSGGGPDDGSGGDAQ